MELMASLRILPGWSSWVKFRKETVKKLKGLGDDIDKYNKGKNVSKVTGAGMGIGGTALTVGTFLAPVSGGTSLAVAGAVAGVAGAATAIGGEVVANKLTKDTLKLIDEVIQTDREAAVKIEAVIKDFQDVEREIIKYLEERVEACIQKEPECVPQFSKLFKARTETGNKGVDLLYTPFAGLQKLRQLNITKAKQVISGGRQLMNNVKATRNVGNELVSVVKEQFKLGRAVKFALIINIALLPLDIYALVEGTRSLKEKGCKNSKEIRATAGKLEVEVGIAKFYLSTVVQQVKSFTRLIKYIYSCGCEEDLRSLLDNLVKKLLPLQKYIPEISSIDVSTKPGEKVVSIEGDALNGFLINCEGIKDSVYKDIAVIIWAAWKAKSQSVMFLQNTSFTTDPILWTLFGVSINSFKTESEGGVSILLPNNFAGEVIDHHECEKWKGRCMVVNIELEGEGYSLVNALAPEDKISRDLFLKETESFINQKAVGKKVLATNFKEKTDMMTIVVKNSVSRNVSLSLISRLLSFRQVSEYLIHKHAVDGFQFHLGNICKEFHIPEDEKRDIMNIKWQHCTKPIVTEENNADQLKLFINILHLETDLWNKKNRGSKEFSKESEVSYRVLTLSQDLDFFMDEEMMEDVTECQIDHELKFLGFLKQSLLWFHCKDNKGGEERTTDMC